MAKNQAYSVVKLERKPRSIKPLMLADQQQHLTHRKIAEFMDSQDVLGIGFSANDLMDIYGHYQRSVQDAAPSGPQLTPTVMAAAQFLQHWLPGTVATVTQVRKIDSLVGCATVGTWADDFVVLRIVEPIGNAQPYSDLGIIPLSSYSGTYEQRQVYVAEAGFSIGKREQERMLQAGWQDAMNRRESTQAVLQIQRNLVGFYGMAGMATYGFLNDPGLPAYLTVPSGAGSVGTTWDNKAATDIWNDLITAASTLRQQSGDTIDPWTAKCTLAIALSAVDNLNKVSPYFTKSVKDLIASTFPNWRIEHAPELDGASGGNNVFYLYAEQVSLDNNIQSTDDLATFIQVVPALSRLIGLEVAAKKISEDYSMSTAGVLCKRPWAVVRFTGI